MEERQKKRGCIIGNKKNNIMTSAEKERRAFLVSNGLFSLDFNRGW